ncbi:MAG: UDP-N-acetylmuramate dehydrogenase [Candidatus Sungbacteria bacterium]|uniref:UDP-N-acetylenolpyruvoylglucosamine reductase n=1 Tax=Candidatus Sungiibacteriota bacterium TaxID=2750080 RepID=A0A932VRQ2_9BACT|nr:UDP-N-acetylmuramate dehydrogenase [Candidatus Sungbacteria bacterium]
MMQIRTGVGLAPYTIYKIGGPARFFVEAKNAADVADALRFAAQEGAPFFVMGAGSNVLVSDAGFDGLVIRMTGGDIKIEGQRVCADAGAMMARTVMEAARAGLAGFEWGVGIPGTVGGSVRGNAGCFGGQMQDVVQEVKIFDASSAASRRLAAEECEFGYRHSVFKKHPEWIVLSATLHLHPGERAAIQQRVKEITVERGGKQAIGAKSCGCIFKNIAWESIGRDRKEMLKKFPILSQFADRERVPASFLIDRASLKGSREGHAFISGQHANFFVNEGGATACDVRNLIERAKEKVASVFGVLLEEEIQYVGFSEPAS